MFFFAVKHLKPNYFIVLHTQNQKLLAVNYVTSCSLATISYQWRPEIEVDSACTNKKKDNSFLRFEMSNEILL